MPCAMLCALLVTQQLLILQWHVDQFVCICWVQLFDPIHSCADDWWIRSSHTRRMEIVECNTRTYRCIVYTAYSGRTPSRREHNLPTGDSTYHYGVMHACSKHVLHLLFCVIQIVWFHSNRISRNNHLYHINCDAMKTNERLKINAIVGFSQTAKWIISGSKKIR